MKSYINELQRVFPTISPPPTHPIGLLDSILQTPGNLPLHCSFPCLLPLLPRPAYSLRRVTRYKSRKSQENISIYCSLSFQHVPKQFRPKAPLLNIPKYPVLSLNNKAHECPSCKTIHLKKFWAGTVVQKGAVNQCQLAGKCTQFFTAAQNKACNPTFFFRIIKVVFWNTIKTVH